MKPCDLHTHSIYSDGTYTPAEIVNAAENLGLFAVALCDHNTVDGLTEFLSAAQGKRVKAIAGAEFSVEYASKELHLLALFIPQCNFSEVRALMNEVNESKRKSNVDLINALNKAGYDIDFESVKSSTPLGNFNRAHIAAEMLKCGYVQSIKQALDTVLSKEYGYYKEPKRLSFFDMIDFIKSIGALPVLAHPLLNLTEKELSILLPLAKEKGLEGMECYYSTYSAKETELSIELANKFNLKRSGGSDFHGENKPDILLGNLEISLENLTIIKTVE